MSHRDLRRARGLGLVAACVTVVAACGGGDRAASSPSTTSAVPGSAAPAPATVDHVVIVVLENEDAADVESDPAFRAVAARGLRLTQYFAVGHNSLPNYLALTSGVRPVPATANDCPRFDCRLDVPSVASRLEDAGKSWAVYEGGTTTPCLTPAPGTRDTMTSGYVLHHNPFAYYPAAGAGPDGGTPSCRSHMRALGTLGDDLASAALPAYSLVVPDSCEDGHDRPCRDGRPGGLTTSMPWLTRTVAAVTGSPAWTARSVLAVTFDEAEGNDHGGCCGGAAGGRVATVVIGAGARPGTTDATPLTHWALLRSVEAWLGLPGHLGMAGDPATAVIRLGG